MICLPGLGAALAPRNHLEVGTAQSWVNLFWEENATSGSPSLENMLVTKMAKRLGVAESVLLLFVPNFMLETRKHVVEMVQPMVRCFNSWKSQSQTLCTNPFHWHLRTAARASWASGSSTIFVGGLWCGWPLHSTAVLLAPTPTHEQKNKNKRPFHHKLDYGCHRFTPVVNAVIKLSLTP